MLNTTHYAKLFFNEETGNERYGLIQKEAEAFCKNNPTDKCWETAMECYNCELYYMQMFAVYIMGVIDHKQNRHTIPDFVKKAPKHT